MRARGTTMLCRTKTQALTRKKFTVYFIFHRGTVASLLQETYIYHWLLLRRLQLNSLRYRPGIQGYGLASNNLQENQWLIRAIKLSDIKEYESFNTKVRLKVFLWLKWYTFSGTPNYRMSIIIFTNCFICFSYFLKSDRVPLDKCLAVPIITN